MLRSVATATAVGFYRGLGVVGVVEAFPSVGYWFYGVVRVCLQEGQGRVGSVIKIIS